jgi:thioredoxin 1
MSTACSTHEFSSGMVGASKEHMKTVIEIPGVDCERELRSAARLVLAHFYTSWSAQCRILSPSLEALASELEDELQVARVNLDQSPELARRYGITNVPVLILFDNGAPIASLDAWKAHLQGLLSDYATQRGN